MKARKKGTGVGWHMVQNTAPHKGKGSATVEPVRKRRDIFRIKNFLKDHPRDLALFTFGISTGYRAGDLLSIRWDDVLNDDSGTIKHNVSLLEGKTQKRRTMPITNNMKTTLQSLIDSLGGIDQIDPGAPVFVSNRNAKLTVQRLHQMVNAWCEGAGLKGHFGTHTLRKTFGLHNYKRHDGLTIPELMESFNHSSEATTLRYLGISQSVISAKIRAANL